MKRTNKNLYAGPKYDAPACAAFEMTSEGLICVSEYGQPGNAGGEIPYVEELETY